MLFFNFLCLIYLMVYSNGHTISKNIDTDEETYEVFDTIANLDSNKHHRNRHNRIHQNYERNDINTKALDVSESYIFPEFVTRANEAANNLNITRDDNINNVKRTAIKRSTVGPGRKAREKKHFKNKEKGLWARFTGNHRNTEPNSTTAFMLRPPEVLKQDKQDKAQKEKNKNAYGDSLYATFDANNTTEGMDNVFVTIELIGTELNKLKDLYSGNNLGDKNIPFVSTDFPKTAEIEEVLTSIKMKSIETIIENDPGVIEVISNSVTETTYTTSMDKLVPATGSTSYADYAESNLFQDKPLKKRLQDISMKKRPDLHSKDEINDIKPEMDSFESHKRTKKLAVRSVTHKCSPLERFELDVKRIYNKMKSKVYRKTPNALVRTSIKETQVKTKSTKPLKKLRAETSVDFNYLYAASPNATSPIPPKQIKLKGNLSDAKHSQRSVKQEKIKLLKDVSNNAGYDKTYEKNFQDLQGFNLLTMIATTPKSNKENKQKKDYRSTKRSHMTLRKHERNEALNGIIKSDFELSDPFNFSNVSERLRRKAVYTDLSKKISYNDYVNGYKHYLKFQRELGKDDDNFSPMVKYQAHRHHKVDDIGKFILNKIPQVTTCDDKRITNLKRQKRYFVDKKLIDNKPSITADSDWINKHILFLLDKHPKKFHTSQIVPLKSPVNNVGSERFITKMYKKHQEKYISDDSGAEPIDVTLDNELTTKIDLDALSRALHGYENRSLDYAVTNVPEPEISRQECKECNGEQEPLIHMNNSYQLQIPIRLMRSLQVKQKKTNSSVHSKAADKNKIENATKFTSPARTLLSTVKQAPHKENKNQHKKYYRNMHTPTLATVAGRSSNSTSKSKFRGLFRKFHLNSRNSEKKYKRAGSTRLDPIKRLKNIFNMGQSRSKADRFQLPDTPQETKTTPEMTEPPKLTKSTRPLTKSPKKNNQSPAANITETTNNYQSMTSLNNSLIHSPITFKKKPLPNVAKTTNNLSDIDKNIQRLSDIIKNSAKSSPVLNKNNHKSSNKNATNKNKKKDKNIQYIDISKILQHKENKNTEDSPKKTKMVQESSIANKNSKTTPHKNKMIQFIPKKSLNKTIADKANKIKSLLHSTNINANVQSFPTVNKYTEHSSNIIKNVEHSQKLNKFKEHSPNLNKYNENSPKINKNNEHSPNLNKNKEHSPNLNKYIENTPNFNKYKEHSPNLNKYIEHSRNLNKYNEHLSNLNKYNEHLSNLNKYIENSTNLNKYNEHSPNFNKYDEHSPNLNKYNEHSPKLNKYNENSPKLNKYNENTPNLNRYNEHSPNINKFNEHTPTLNRYNEHSPNSNKFNEHSPTLNRYNEHSPSINKFNEHAPTLNRYNEHSPNINKFNEHTPTLNRYNEHSPNSNKFNEHSPTLNRYNEHSPSINKFNEHAPTLNRYNEHLPNVNKFNEHSPNLNRYTEHSPNINKFNEHSPNLNKYNEHSPNINKYNEHTPNINKYDEHPPNINFEHSPDINRYIEKSLDINKYIEQSLGINKNIEHLPDFNKNIDQSSEINKNFESHDINNNFEHLGNNIEHSTIINSNLNHSPDEFGNGEPWINIDRNNKYSQDKNKNEPLINIEKSKEKNINIQAPIINKHVEHRPDNCIKISPNIHKHIQCDSDFLKNIKHLPDFLKNHGLKEHQYEYESSSSSSSSTDLNKNNNDDSEFLKSIEHSLDMNKNIYHGPSKNVDPVPDFHETTEDDAELLQEIEDTLHLTIKNQHGSTPIENIKHHETSVFNKFTSSGSDLIKAMELVLNINKDNTSEALNKNTPDESGIHAKYPNLQYINKKVHRLSEAIKNNQHTSATINSNNKTLEQFELEKTINKNIHRGTEVMKKTAHEASKLLKNVVHTTTAKCKAKKLEYSHNGPASVKNNKNLKNKSRTIQDESEIRDKSNLNKIVKLEEAKELHNKMPNAPHLDKLFSLKNVINTESPFNIGTKSKYNDPFKPYKLEDMKANLGANISADNLVTKEYISEASDLIEPLPVFPDHTTKKYENFASIFNEPDVHDPSVLRDMLPFGFRTTKKGLFYKKLKGALHLHQDKSKGYHTELDNVYPTEKSSPLLTEKDDDLFPTEKGSLLLTEKYNDLFPTEKNSLLLTEKYIDLFPTEKNFLFLTEKDDYSQEANNAYSTERLRVNRKESKKNREPNHKKKKEKKLKSPPTAVTKPFKMGMETLPDLNLEIARMQNALAKKYGTATAMYNHNPVFTAIMTLMGGQNIGGTIDKVYKRHLTKMDSSDKNEAESFSHTTDFETKQTPALMVDSTLLSYDGEVETVTNAVQLNQVNNSEPKGKESTMSSKVKNVMLHKPKVGKIITKAKERPEMYYSTPLPMKPEDFARFLKDQGMDVASVTSPLRNPLPGFMANQRKLTTTQITNGLKTKCRDKNGKRENRRGWFSSEDERVIILNDNSYDKIEEEKALESDKARSKEDAMTRDTADAKFLPTFEPKFDRLSPKVKLEPRWHSNETSFDNFGSEFYNVQYNSSEPKEITEEEISQLEEKPTTRLAPEVFHPDIPTRSNKPLHNALLYNRTNEYVMPASSSKPGTKKPSTKTNATTASLFGDDVQWPQLLNPEEVHISSHHYNVDICFKKHLPKPITESSTPEISFESTEYNLENDKYFQEITEKSKYKKDIMKTKRPHSNGIRAAVKRHRKRSYLKALPHNMKYFPDGIFNKRPEEVENTISSPVSRLENYTTTETPTRLLRKSAYNWEFPQLQHMIKYKADPINPYKQSCMEQQNKDVQYDILDAFKYVIEPESDLRHDNKGIHYHHRAFDEDRETPHHNFKYDKEGDDKRLEENIFEINQKQDTNKYRPNNLRGKATELFSLIPHITSTTTEKTKTAVQAALGSTEVEYIAKQDKGHKTVIVPVSKSIKNLAVTESINDEAMSPDKNWPVAMELTKFDTVRTTMGKDVSIYGRTNDMNVAEMEDDKLNIQLESSLENSLESKNQKLIEVKKNKHKSQTQKLNTHETLIKSTPTPTTSLHKSDTTSKQHTTKKVLNTTKKKKIHFKRNAETQSTCIAKDVAALEVVVDLMKNIGDEEKEIGSVPTAPTYYTIHNDATNAIQLHIVVPCDVETGLKRSLGPTRVRKIFSAKMSTPVDLEYQVHSVEESPTFELLTTTPAASGLSPGMYLLLSKPNDGYALKPVRFLNRTSTLTTKENIIENTARLKLSKDFVEAVSNKIEELFDNLNIVNKSQVEPRKRRQTVSTPITLNRKSNCKKKPTGLKQLLKKYFGYDNVCNCKCVAGRPMCRDCAASNAVIEELITEFDNIVKYMTDHCTEIQTYFWMNPSGGLKLRDSVDKVSKNLHAYYKRTKGKCKGKPCNSLANHIDKRQFARTSKADQNKTNKTFLGALITAPDNFNKTFKSILDYNKFEKKGEKMAREISSYIPNQAVTKRFDPEIRKKKIVKNVYSLDSININLICNSDNTSLNPFASTVPLTLSSENPNTLYSNDFDYKDSDPKPKGFKSLFWNNIKKKDKDKRFFFKKSFKRDALQVNTSSAADNGDIIWIDTKPSSNNEYQIVRRTVKTPQPEPVKEYLYTEPATGTDYFSQNLNKVLDLFQNLQDVESSVSNSNGSSLSQTSQSMQPEETTLTKPTTHQETFAQGHTGDKATTTKHLTSTTKSTKLTTKSTTKLTSKLTTLSTTKLTTKLSTKLTTKSTTKLTTKFDLLKSIKKTLCPGTKSKSTTNHVTTATPHSSTLAGKPATTANRTTKSTVTKAKLTKAVPTSKHTTVSSTNKPAASTHTTSKSSATISKSKAIINSASKVITSTPTANKTSSITTLLQKSSSNVPAISSLRTLLSNTSGNVIETYYIIYPESDPDSAYPDNLYSDIFLPDSDNSLKRSTGLSQNSLDDIHKQIDAISNEIQYKQHNTAAPDQYETKIETEVKQKESEQKLTENEQKQTNGKVNQNGSEHKLTETEQQAKSDLKESEPDQKLTETEFKQTESGLNQNEPKLKLTENKYKQTKSQLNQNEPEQKVTETEYKQTESGLNQNEPKLKVNETEYKQTKSELNPNEPEPKVTETEYKQTKSQLNQNAPEQKVTETESKQNKNELNQNEPEPKVTETEYKQTKSQLNQNAPEQKVTETEYKQNKNELNQNEPEPKVTEPEYKQTKSEPNQNELEHEVTETEHKLAETEHKLAETEHKLAETEYKLSETEHTLTETENKLTESKLNQNVTEQNQTRSGLIQAETDLNRTEDELNETDTELRAHSHTRPPLYHIRPYPKAWHTQSFWVRLDAASMPLTQAHTSPEPKKKTSNLKITQTSAENNAKLHNTSKDNVKSSNITQAIIKFLGKCHKTDTKKKHNSTNPFKSTKSTVTTAIEHENKIFEEVKITKSIDEANKITDGILSLKKPSTLGIDDYDDFKNNTESEPTVAAVKGLDLLNDSLKMKNGNNRDESKKLLLSIIEYEMGRLNDEWQDIAKVVEGDNEFKRSVIHTSSAARQSISTIPQNANATETEQQSETERTGLLNKLFGIKVAKRKAAHSASTCVSTSAVSTFVAVDNETTAASCTQHTTTPSTWTVKPKMPRDQKRKIKNDEARLFCPSRNAVCDLQATFNYVAELRDQVTQKTFEKYVKEVPCHKYKRLKRGFLIHHKTSGLKWNWIRSKRSAARFIKHQNVDNCDDQTCSFEKFVKGADGIYKLLDREKRSTGKSLDYKLRDFRPLKIAKDELYVMAGDSVVLECPLEPPHIAYTEYSWEADPGDLIDHGNVEVNGPTLDIKKIAPRNAGRYSCSVDGIIRRSNVVTVVSLPTVDVVFIPTYKTQRDCTYDDLRAIQQLGREMSKAAGCGDICSIRIDEPVCQRDKVSNKSVIKSTGVLTMSAHHLECSVMCRRDTFASLVRLALADIPVMENSKVILSKDNVNETLVPYFVVSKLVTTHTLRKKDSSGHFEYRKSKMLPGRVKPVIICGGGYYLVNHAGICVPCPSKTRSSAGDNTCSPCPPGMSSARGATECHDVLKRPRRYDWWWYPPCGYVVALSILVCACGLLLGLALVIHLVSRGSTERMSTISQDKTYHKRSQMTAACMQSTRGRHVSPSRVILARFFKYSMSSSKGTIVDSQETRFERWKEKNMPPSLPTIDFDLETS